MGAARQPAAGGPREREGRNVAAPRFADAEFAARVAAAMAAAPERRTSSQRSDAPLEDGATRAVALFDQASEGLHDAISEVKGGEFGGHGYVASVEEHHQQVVSWLSQIVAPGALLVEPPKCVAAPKDVKRHSLEVQAMRTQLFALARELRVASMTLYHYRSGFAAQGVRMAHEIRQRNTAHERARTAKRAVDLDLHVRRVRLSAVKKRMRVLAALQMGLPLLPGHGTIEDARKHLLLYYRLTGIELTMPPRLKVVSGFKWRAETSKRVQSQLLADGVRLEGCDKLMEALANGKTNFDKDEWRAFGVGTILGEHFVQCRAPSGIAFFTPDEEPKMESEHDAQERVIRETMQLTAEDKERLLAEYAKSSLQWKAAGTEEETQRCALLSCAMCGLRDPEKQEEVERYSLSQLDELPWIKLSAHECWLRRQLGKVELVELQGAGRQPTRREVDVCDILSTWQMSPRSDLYHLHSELVEVGADDVCVQLCRRCGKAVDQRHEHAPPLSIAAGVDFGAMHRLGLDEPSELEEMLLSGIRCYRLTLKVAVMANRNEPMRQQLQSHLITFEHEGDVATSLALNEACQWAKEAFNVVFVGSQGDYDVLQPRLGGLGPLRARPDVCYNLQTVRDRLDAVYRPGEPRLPIPDIEDVTRMLDALRTDLLTNTLVIEDTTVDAEQVKPYLPSTLSLLPYPSPKRSP